MKKIPHFVLFWSHDLRDAVERGNLTKAQADKLDLVVREYFAEHWRDDDSPQYEESFGVCQEAA